MRSNTLRSLVFSLPILALSVPALASYQVTTDMGDAVAAEVISGDPQDTAEFLVKATITGDEPTAVVVALLVNADPATATFPSDFTLAFPSSSAPSNSACLEDGGSETITYAAVSTGGNTFNLTLGAFDTTRFATSTFPPPMTFICRVTINAVDDVIIEGVETLNLTIDPSVGAASSSNPLSQSFTIGDNDIAGIFVTDTDWTGSTAPGTGSLTGKTTSENGTPTASFWVELASAPSGDVTVDVASDTPAEALVSAGSGDVSSLVLSFTPANWDTGQRVTITGQDDAPANPPDGNKNYQVTVTTDNTQPDSTYRNLAGGPVAGINEDNDVPGQFRFTQSSVSGNEGDTLTLQVERINGSSGPASVDYSISNGSASGSDYNDTTSSTTLSWANGVAGTQDITITLVDDTLWEPASEDFTVTLSNPTVGTLAAPSAQTVNINPSDEITVTITPQLNPNEVTEGNTGDPQVPVLFDVDYTGGTLESPLPITWKTVDVLATGGVDYAAVVTAGINLPTSGATVTITVNVNGDNTPENDETFKVQLSESLNLVTLAGGGSSTATILNDDTVTEGIFSITSITPNPVGETAGPVTVTVSRTGASGTVAATNIRLLTADGPVEVAVDPGDYAGTTGTILSWVGGDVATVPAATEDKTFTIAINDNAGGESDENFTVTIEKENPGDTTQLGTTTGTVTIIGDPTVAFSPDGYTVSENGGSVTVLVERLKVDDQPVSVDYEMADVSAVAGQDYTASTGTFSWAAADLMPKSVTIPIMADADTAGPETFTVDLLNCVNCTISDAQTIVTITEDAVPPSTPGSLAFSPSGITVSEPVGSAGLFVTRTGGTDGAVTVGWETQPGTAMAPGDYTTSSGTLSWNDGEGGSKPIAVSITDDAVQETPANESFTVRFVPASETGTKGLPTVSGTPATVTITDNDSPVPGEFSILDANVSEGDGTINVTVTRDVGSTGAVAVTYTTVSSGDATGGNPAVPATDDYLYTTDTLNWIDGDSAPKTITITIVDDAVVEPAEMFTVDLSSPTNGASIADGSANVTIFDNDGGGTFSISDVTVFEQDGQATVTVTRANDNDTAAFVFWNTFDGTAQDESGSGDYQSGSGQLTWLAGDTSSTRTITIPIITDALDEDSEFFIVRLGAVKGESASIIKADGIVTINDPIPIPTLSQWAMGLLILLLLGLGIRVMPGRGRASISRS